MPALLYGDVRTDYMAVLAYLDGFSESLGLGESGLHVNTDELSKVLLAIRHEFPHRDGMAKASVFKKAANFIVFFMATAPITAPSRFPEGALPQAILEIPNHVNAVVAFELAIDSLHGAVVHHEKNGKRDVTLSNRIRVSGHSYADVIDALSRGITPLTHFKLVTVLLEQLAYRANPDASYTLIED